ncbi:MAG TPA: type VI secretion protein IcmF/TssM N-terminal domain-containing protein [Pirellulales bacterium]|jgi:hypothetical protein|nr:type VI secretion protein IcmF/TssM N-terminal domain-containing protein [Pirellulales bacterium]
MGTLFSYLMAPLQALTSAPRRLLGLSLPARVAMLVAVFLICCVVTVYVAFYFSANRPNLEVWWQPGRLTLIAVLIVVIPLVVYQALKLWLQGEVSRFPDIDYAWKAGLAELQANGLDLGSVPIFLVLGTTGPAQERNLFHAARMTFRVNETPKGPAALHWYATPEAIYICCTEIGQMSKLAASGEKSGLEPMAVAAPSAPAGGGDIRGTIMAGAEPGGPPSLGASMLMPVPMAGTTGALPRGEASGGGDIRGTMMVGHDVNVGQLVAQMQKNVVALKPQDTVEQQHRLEYVCRLLRRARLPLCPINGVLTLLPYGVIQLGQREAMEVERTVKADMATLRQELKLRCPVTALVVGLDRDKGFRELVRRVGADKAKNQRFGKGFGVWGTPTAQNVEAVCAHACGAFEDFVYALFREVGALAKPGNTKLYALLCNVRRNLQSRLTSILAGGYGRADDAPGDELLFGGCYFAAVGDGDDRQAFVKSVLDKLIEQQEELEWTSTAIAEELRSRRIATLLWAFDGAMLLVLGGTLFYKFYGS